MENAGLKGTGVDIIVADGRIIEEYTDIEHRSEGMTFRIKMGNLTPTQKSSDAKEA